MICQVLNLEQNKQEWNAFFSPSHGKNGSRVNNICKNKLSKNKFSMTIIKLIQIRHSVLFKIGFFSGQNPFFSFIGSGGLYFKMIIHHLFIVLQKFLTQKYS